MALPQLTPEQREEALKKAAEARKTRADLKEALKIGATPISEVLNSDDEIVTKMKVADVLRSMPKVGKIRAEEIMEEIGITPTRRVRGLGDRQKQALLDRFS